MGERADQRFARILGKGVSEIGAIIDAFNSKIDESDRFSTLAKSIRAIDFNDDGNQITVSGSKKNVVGAPERASASGIMYRSKLTNEIYKKIPIESRYELDIFFLEAFIAVVLSTHPTVGEYICVPTRAFRSMGSTRQSNRLADSGASARPLPVERPSLYLLMDVIPYNYRSWLIRKPANISVLQHYLPIIRQLAVVLGPLEDDFRFCHNDLHAENFLITEGGEVRLIDFGRSSVRFNGRMYGHNRDNLAEPSFEFSCDMLTFLVDFYRSSGDRELRTFIRSLFASDDGLNLLDLIEAEAAKAGMRYAHHMCYPYRVWGYRPEDYEPWSEEMRQRLRDTPSCCRPASVVEAIDDFLSAPRAPGENAVFIRKPKAKSCFQCIRNGILGMCCGSRKRRGGRRRFNRKTTRRQRKQSRSTQSTVITL